MFRVTHNSERLGKNTDHRFSGGWGMEMQRVKFSSEILEFSSELVQISSEPVSTSLELLIISVLRKCHKIGSAHADCTLTCKDRQIVHLCFY